MMDLLRHFFTRGHDGRVTCVDASAAADFVVSGGVDYTVRTAAAARGGGRSAGPFKRCLQGASAARVDQIM